MNDKPLFSVIIPVYKVEKFIYDCVLSVQKQSYKNIEIILVDDGSPDLCPEICDNFANEDSRIKVIHCENGGAAAARKQGCNSASGQYVLFLDGDDWLSTDCLSVLEEQVRESSADIICFGMYYGDGKKYKKVPVDYRYGYYSKSDIESEIFPSLIQKSDVTYFMPSLCGKAIKKELFRNYALVDRRCTIGEDGACVIPCVFHSESMVILEDCFYYYRYNFESTTKGKRIIDWSCPEIIFDHIVKHIDVDVADFKDQLKRKLTHDLFTVTVSQFYRSEPYKNIINDIKNNLNNELYKDAIANSTFADSLLATLMKLSLKKHLFPLLYIYSKL